MQQIDSGQSFTEARSRKYTEHTLLALGYLHSHGIVHRAVSGKRR